MLSVAREEEAEVAGTSDDESCRESDVDSDEFLQISDELDEEHEAFVTLTV